MSRANRHRRECARCIRSVRRTRTAIYRRANEFRLFQNSLPVVRILLTSFQNRLQCTAKVLQVTDHQSQTLHCLRAISRVRTSLLKNKNRRSPFRPPCLLVAFNLWSLTSIARKTKSAPRYRYSRSGNQDMQAPTNTIGRGSTSLLSSLFLPFSLLLSHFSSLTHTTYTPIHPLFLSLSFSLLSFFLPFPFFSLCFSLISCLFLTFSLSHSHPLILSFSVSRLLSLSLFPRCTERFNGTISPFAGNGASGDAIRRATR